MKKFYSLLDWIIEQVENICCAIPMAIVLVIEAAHVISRYAFRSGIVWSDEVITNLLVVVVMFGGARAIRLNEHTELTGTADALPKPIRTVVRVITTGSTLTFLVVSFLASILFISTSGTLKTTYLRVPKVICYLPLAIGGFLMVYEFVKTIKYRITRDVIDIYDPDQYKEEEE